MKAIQQHLAYQLVSFVLAINSVFAASFQFDVGNQEPLYRTSLPKAVYTQSNSNGLQDLSITNAAGEQLPYTLVPHTTLYPPSTTKVDSQPLLVFPIEEVKLSYPEALRIHLEKTSINTTVNVSSSTTKNENALEKTIYLVDIGEKHPDLQTLTFNWQGAEERFVGLEILASDDLKNWSHAGNAVLLKAAQAGNTILNDTATLDHSVNVRYLQIRLNEPGKSPHFKLNAVNAEYRSQQAMTQPVIWQDLNFLTRTQDHKTGQINLEFEAIGRYPASRLHVNLPQTNTITNATVLVRNNTNEPWVYLCSTSLYNMTQHGRTMTNPNISLHTTTARFWQLQFGQASGGIGAENPTLSVGWLPDTIVWNARGAAPFSLHVGEKPDISHKVSVTDLMPDFKIEKVRNLPQAKLTTASSASSNAKDTSLNQQSAWTRTPDYKTWTLWGGLFLGVLLLAGMAYSLLKTGSKQ